MFHLVDFQVTIAEILHHKPHN
nr:truncated ORF6 protein [Severe acute respiratory syndrome coronavirus 2]